MVKNNYLLYLLPKQIDFHKPGAILTPCTTYDKRGVVNFEYNLALSSLDPQRVVKSTSLESWGLQWVNHLVSGD